MVGILTMASPVEDFGIQPCKKPRKDDDLPVKTITNYFSPLVKSVDRVFSPPKSNSIKDYFKSTPPKKDTNLPQNDGKISEHVKPFDNLKTSQSPVTTPQVQLRRRKKVTLEPILSDLNPGEHQSAIEISTDKVSPSQDPETTCTSVGFMGSDTAALLAQICNESELSGVGQQFELSSDISDFPCRSNALQNSLKYDRRSRKRKFNNDETTPGISAKNLEHKLTKEVKQKPDSLHILSSSFVQNKSTLTDSSLEVNIDETSRLNNDSVVTVSFEDFLKSQSETDYCSVAQDSVLENLAQSNDADRSGSGTERSENNPLSTKKMTVLVQVHSSPPKSPSKMKHKKTEKKIASIFLKKNNELKTEFESLTGDEQAQQMLLKRKSNVVIEEEDLELAVLEVSGSESVKPKSTVEERKQFMKAFRQPSLDAGKTAQKKAAGKPVEINNTSLTEDTSVDEGNIAHAQKCKKKPPKTSKVVSENTVLPPPETFEKNVKSKVLKKRRKPVEISNEAETAERPQNTSKSQQKEIDTDLVDDGSNENISSVIEKSRVVLRRSSRQRTPDTSQSETPTKIQIDVSETLPTNGPLQVSTPKVSNIQHSAFKNMFDGPSQVSTPKLNRRSLRKNNMYKSEMIISSEIQSPIRMRFTRLVVNRRKNGSETGEDSEFTPRSKKVPGSSKKVSEAKKLVKKAKNIQHNISKTTLETQPPTRRSSRQQALSERNSYQETEDCMFVESDSENRPASKRKPEKKKLRSLNDVLGKNRKIKTISSSNGPPKAFVCGKKVKHLTGSIAVDDDSSKDASENSQDGEQFKAKREFLMSGLPDSLKRHIAKTTAALEAYSAASSCYQTVTHVQQKEDCVLMWSLPWPLNPFLIESKQFNEDVRDVSKHIISLGMFTDANSKHKVISGNMRSGWREEFSAVVVKYLLEEIRSCNPQFPVRRFLKQFKKRHAENFPQPMTSTKGCTDFPNSEIGSPLMCSEDSEKENKRKSQEMLKSKRKKGSSSTGNLASMHEENPILRKSRRNSSGEVKGETSCKGKLSRSSRKKQVDSSEEKTEDCEVIVIEESMSTSKHVSSSDSVSDDVLWTEKYQPQDSSELIGNSGAIKKLHGWLKEWKARADREEKKSQREKRHDENLEQDNWRESDFEGDSGDGDSGDEDFLCNTVLITGPSGVGKTAAVYACAQELGFKVFEVNASCQRSGRQILSQLKEATQSHQVDKQGMNSHKHCLFNTNNASKSPSSCDSSKLKDAQSTGKGVTKTVDKEVLDESNRKSATSLILFEEVDVIFEDDQGFLSAVKTFMATTKRPVILTTSDATFSLLFDGIFEEINFKAPSPSNVASYLQVLCLAENLRTDVRDLATLLNMNNCDIRHSILFLQYWARSGGGYMEDKALSICEKSESIPSACAEDSAHHKMSQELNLHLPKCDTGCVENLLGLKNILSPSEDLMSFIKYNITKTEQWTKLVQLLQTFQMRNINFIFNNIELLLPLPVSKTECEKIAVASDAKLLTNHENINPDSGCSQEDSPIKMSMQMKRKRKLDQSKDFYNCDYNSGEEFLTLPNPLPSSNTEEIKDDLQSTDKGLEQGSPNNSEKRIQTPAEQQCSFLVSQCLDSLTKFLEDVSFLDCCVYSEVGEQNERKDMEYNWTDGCMKNGLCDEYRIENRDWWHSQSCGELKATVEVLSFQNCCSLISKAMGSSMDACKKLGKDPTEELTLGLPKYREEVFFSQSAVDVSLAQKRILLIKNVFSNCSLMTVGNRRASIVEYLPILRNICKSEKVKEQEKWKRRFLHYFEGINLELPKTILLSLAADFP
ncbi:ATPase family AAA domain-containing protein 5 isoform X2 [Pleurodeles waltl]|uniref:ATPase family AAA domain-containing protein 5 isoform X2 n=1 Tax=Pleurodeles waltl TaxID=8319 RepID=UPI00370976C4